jgi:hypothetical protein
MFRQTRISAGVIVAASLTIAAAGPSTARAAAAEGLDPLPPGSYLYRTALTPLFGAGAYEGVLRFTVANDGSIIGVFRNADVGVFRTVVGGRKGHDLWLDLGPGSSGRVINATVKNGEIVGGVYADGQPYRFVADPDTQ